MGYYLDIVRLSVRHTLLLGLGGVRHRQSYSAVPVSKNIAFYPHLPSARIQSIRLFTPLIEHARARNCIVGRALSVDRTSRLSLKGLAKRTIVPSERPQPQPRRASETVYEQRHRHHYVPISRALRKRPRLGPS